MAIELLYPFRADASGAIASTTDVPTQVQQHVLAVIGTQPGERVMRSTYGLDTMSLLFETPDQIDERFSSAAVESALGQVDEGVTLLRIDRVAVDTSLAFTVHYSMTNGVEGAATVNAPVSTI